LDGENDQTCSCGGDGHHGFAVEQVLEDGYEEPKLHDQQDEAEHQQSDEEVGDLAFVGLSNFHASALAIPVAQILPSSILRVICGRGRGGGPWRTSPFSTENAPLWQGQ